MRRALGLGYIDKPKSRPLSQAEARGFNEDLGAALRSWLSRDAHIGVYYNAIGYSAVVVDGAKMGMRLMNAEDMRMDPGAEQTARTIAKQLGLTALEMPAMVREYLLSARTQQERARMMEGVRYLEGKEDPHAGEEIGDGVG